MFHDVFITVCILFPNKENKILIQNELYYSKRGQLQKSGCRATFRKMPEAGLKIAQKGVKNTFFGQNFAEART